MLYTGLMNDIRFAVRQARKRVLFSLALVAVLAIGLGANTAVFSVLYSAVLEPLPFPNSSQLVAVHNRLPLENLPRLNASPLDYLDLREHHELFSDAGGYYYLDMNRTGIAIPVKVNAVAATASLFHTLGVQPLLGRLFNPEEERYHGPHAVVLSEDYWRTAFGADPNIRNRSLLLDGELYPVIGVMPNWFQVPNNVTQMWTPLAFSPRSLLPSARKNHYMFMYARLAPGLTFADAAARLEQLSRQMSRLYPSEYPQRLGWSFFLQPLAQDNDGSQRMWLWSLFAAVTCLLLIITVNLAALLAVRSVERHYEVAVRLALGASRFRIARQIVTEVLFIAMLGGIAALGVLAAALRLLARYSPLHSITAHPPPPVLLFGFLLSLVTGLASSLPPVWVASASGLREAGHQRSASGRKLHWRNGFIIGQVALATALLLTGGLFIRSLLRLTETSLGFDPHNVLTAQVSLPHLRYPTQQPRLQFYESVLANIRSIPGVEAASACGMLPFGWGFVVNTFQIVGQPKPQAEPSATVNEIFPDYFATLRIPILRGRNFNDADRASSHPVALVDATLADRYFPGRDPLGQSLQLIDEKAVEIIGIVARVRETLDHAPRPTIYLDTAQRKPLDLTLVIRSSLGAENLEASVRHAVAQTDKDQPVYDVIPLDWFIAHSLQTRRFVVWLVILFAALGTLLAAIGLYALLSYTVLLRTREIGIRLAIGATRSDIRSLVARIAILPALVGVLSGCATAAGFARAIASQLYATTIWDRTVWLAVLAIVLTACAAACAAPMWRAARVEPLTALRAE